MIRRRKKLYLVSWESIPPPGGLGIRPINIVNWAFIAKLLLQLLSEPDCLWTWVMKHKYFPKELLSFL